MSKPICVVVGVGPGNGAAIARKFSEAGQRVVLLARTIDFISALAAELQDATAIACDIGNEAQVAEVFAQIREQIGEVSTLVYNAGSGAWGTVEDISPAAFEANWRVNTFGALLASQQVIPAMKAAGAGNIVFIGATASRRGGAKSAAFAPAKAAQRSLVESMARHLWPMGIHVSLLIIDGIVDLAQTRKMMPDKPDAFFVKPVAVADSVFQLCMQDRSAWSFEIEARPFGEVW